MLVIGAGVTLIEALEAAKTLAKEDINIRVMDPFTLKPLDKEAVIMHAKAVGGKILTVEDHYVEGNTPFQSNMLSKTVNLVVPMVTAFDLSYVCTSMAAG